MISNKSKTFNEKLNETFPHHVAFVFGTNLCAYLDDPTPEKCLNIRYFYQQCSGITCKGRRCRHKVKVEAAYDSAEKNPPKVYCTKHTQRVPDQRNFNLVIGVREVPSTGSKGNCVLKHTREWVGAGTPMLEDTDITAYQILTYIGDDPTPRPRLLEEGQLHGFDCDKSVWVNSTDHVRIYYVREAGHIHRTQVSTQTQMDNRLLTYKDTVRECMVEAGSGDCAVCLESKPLWNLGCDHKFCMDCIARFACKKAACPMCRAEIQCLAEMANNQGTLDRLQLESPDYEVRKTEIDPDCVHTFAYKIAINNAGFRYPDMHFSLRQTFEYRVLAMLLENKLVFVNSTYDDQVYVRTRLFGNVLMDRIRCHDTALVQDLVDYAIECGIGSDGLLDRMILEV